MLTFNCGSNYEIFVQYKTKTSKKVRRFHNVFVNFQNFTNIKKCCRQLFEIMSIHKPSLGSCEVPHTIWAQSVQTF